MAMRTNEASSRVDVNARYDGERNPEQGEATLQAYSYMTHAAHATQRNLAYSINEISALDHVPQTNRLDHVLYTKQLP